MDGPLYMDAVITPHRSLSRKGFIVLISVLTTINTATAVVFLLIGAWPAPLFLGLDVIAVIVAFIASGRAVLRKERIQVTADEVRVVLETPRGEHTVWQSPTAFTRVAVAGEAEDVHLRLSDRAVPVARALTRRERRDFAEALERAIHRARADPIRI